MQSEEIVNSRNRLKPEDQEDQEDFESDMSKNWSDNKLGREISKWRIEVLGLKESEKPS